MDDLVLHLVLAGVGGQAGVEVLDKALDAAQLVEGQSVVVDAEEHLETAAERVLVQVLVLDLLLGPEQVVAQLLVRHQLVAPAGQLGHDAADLVHQVRVLEEQALDEAAVDALLVLLGVEVEQVHAVLVLVQQVIDQRGRVLER